MGTQVLSGAMKLLALVALLVGGALWLASGDGEQVEKSQPAPCAVPDRRCACGFHWCEREQICVADQGLC